MATNRWMGKVADKIKSSGHKGIFRAAAHRAGKSTAEFAREHEHDKGKLGKRARLAEAFASARKK
jgi:hypothetical protein